MRRSLFAVLAVAALVTAASLLTAGSGCASFGEAGSPASDGGAGDVAVEPPRPRTVVVEAGWPSVATLDPSGDLRLTKIVVTVVDATDASRRVVKTASATEKGPYSFVDFNTSNLVDVTIELGEGSGRLLGYGERRRWSLATSDTVPVAARKRLLYFASGDRGDGQLRMFDLASASKAEPGMVELDAPALPSLAKPSALYVTTDGLLLVQAGQAPVAGGGGAGGAAQLSVIETGTHRLSKTISLASAFAAALPLGDGHRLLGAPAASAKKTTFAIVDIDTMAVTELPTGLQGGALSISAMATSPDGAHVAAVGSYDDGKNGEAPYAFIYDVGSPSANSTALASLVDVARGVRFMPDGKTVVVAGAKSDGEWATGALLFFDATGGALTQPTRSIALAARLTRAASLIIDPAGKSAYVGNEARYYGADQSCCGDLRVIDLASGQEAALFSYGADGPELELTEAIRLPYAPRRVLAGQSDNGNNVHGAVVELLQDSPRPVAVDYDQSQDIGSLDAIATPFGSRL